jgi:hypothetical protein
MEDIAAEEEVKGDDAKSFSKRAGRLALLTTPPGIEELPMVFPPGNSKLAAAVAEAASADSVVVAVFFVLVPLDIIFESELEETFDKDD